MHAMCKMLNIQRSSYYMTVNRKPTKRDIENLALTDIIKSMFAEYHQRYGSKRILRELAHRGIHVNQGLPQRSEGISVSSGSCTRTA